MRFQIGSAYLMGLLLCSSAVSGAELKAEVAGAHTSVSVAITAAVAAKATQATITLKGDTTENPQSDLSTLTTITLENGKDGLLAPKALVSLQGSSTTSGKSLFSKTTGDLNLIPFS